MTVKSSGRTSRAALVTSVIVVIAALRLGRDVLMPFALAVLLSFLLAPLVIFLQRRLGRIAAVSVVTGTTFLLMAATGWLVLGQVARLAGKLPEYRHTISDKIQSLRGTASGWFGRASRTVEEITEEIASPATGALVGPAPAPVEVVPVALVKKSWLLTALGPWVGSAMTLLGEAAVIMVFVVFMLIYYDDLRDRILRLVGTGRLNETTQALEDAAQRVSRYLLMQTVINASHGLVVGVGLYFLGLPAALFWGLNSALLRFIPYLGPLLAAALPTALALAVFDGWTWPLLTIAFFVLLEIISNNVLEPWLYGSSTGLSPMAVIVAAVFWAWLWGGVGLVLSAPLTVCLVVLGKHIAPLEFLNILLSDQPVLDPKDRLYQRLLAMDQEAALEVAEKHLEGGSLEKAYDEVLLPALAMSELDRHRGDLEEVRGRFILENVREMIEELGDAHGRQMAALAGEPSSAPPSNSGPTPIAVLCLPARDEADELAGLMFAQLLRQDGFRARCLSVDALAGEMMDLVEKEGVQIVCVSALPPSAVTHARYLCKRLRVRFERLPIVVGLWTTTGHQVTQRVQQDDSIQAVTTLTSGREAVRQLSQSIVPQT